MRSGMMLWVSLAGVGLVALDSDLEELRVNVFYLDDQFQLNPSGSIAGSGTITIQGGETFRVESSPGGDAKLTPSK